MKVLILILVIIILCLVIFFLIKELSRKLKEISRLEQSVKLQKEQLNELNKYIESKESIKEWAKDESEKAKENPQDVIAAVIHSNNSRVQNNKSE